MKQTASKKRQNLSSTLCLEKKSWRKNHQFFQIHQINMNNNSWWFQEYETRTKIKKEVITTSLRLSSTMSHKKSRSCVKRCSFTQNLANKTFVEWGHKKFSWILTSIENHIFCQKLIKRHFVVNEFLSYQNLISQSMFGVTKIDKKILYQNRLNDVFFAYQ